MSNDFDFTDEDSEEIRRTFRPRKPPLSRLVYILLGLFLGLLGIHNFYARRVGIGLIQLILSILIIPIPVVLVWVLVEIVVVDRDGNGRYLE